MKKKNILLYIGCILLAVLFAASCFLCGGVLISAENAFSDTRRMCIVLDAGHGGIDGGVTGRKLGLKESEVNLAVTLRLKDLLDSAGFYTVLTRKTGAGLYDIATKGFKKRDMLKRKSVIESARPVAMISLHQNFYPTGGSRGGQVFYKKDSENGKMLAAGIQRQLNFLYADEGVKARKEMPGNYYILKCTEYTSVIVECGFLSNAADETLLSSGEFLGKIAESVYTGLVAYLSSAFGN